MKQAVKKILSFTLALCMGLSILPINVFAGSSVGDISINSVILPIVADSAAMPAVTFATAEKKIYVSETAISVQLPQITYSTESMDYARIQAIDDSNHVVGQTPGFSVYSGVIPEQKLFLLDTLTVGSYRLQLVYGDVENIQEVVLEDYSLTVVSAPVLTYGYINLNSGEDKSSINLRIQGYNGNPDQFEFFLVDMNEQVIPCTKEYVSSSGDPYEDISLTYNITPSSALEENAQYFLGINYNGNSIYSNAQAISSTAYPSFGESIAVLKIEENPDISGGLIVTVGGVKEGVEYQVSASTGYSEEKEVLCSEKVCPVIDNGIGKFFITLMKNGMQLPLSAYSGSSITVEVSSDAGAYDSNYYNIQESYINSSTTFSVKQISGNRYQFVLTARNMLLDIYETENPTLQFSFYDATGHSVGNMAECTTVEKEMTTEAEDVIFTFSGEFDASTPLTAGSFCEVSFNGDNLGSSEIIFESSEELTVSYWSSRMRNYQDNSIWFNFDQWIFEAELAGNIESAKAMFVNEETGVLLSESEEITGQYNEGEGITTFQFVIPKTADLQPGDSFHVQIASGGSTVSVTTEGAAITYDDSKDVDPYIYVEEPVCEGDQTIVISMGDYYLKNASLSDFSEPKLILLNEGAEVGIPFEISKVDHPASGSTWFITLSLDTALKRGLYSIQTDYSGQAEFTVLPKDAPSLGTAEVNSTARTLSVIGCSNLPESTYYASLSLADKHIANLTVSRIDETELILSGFPDILTSDYYTVEIRTEDAFIGRLNYQLGWGEDDGSVCIIRAYPSTGGSSIKYVTDATVLRLETSLEGYAFVRYSEDSSFSGVEYAAVRNSWNQQLTLSPGNGEKNIYVQFKKSTGEESKVYVWTCRKVDSLDSTIQKAWVDVSGAESTHIPDYTPFSLNVITSTNLCSVKAQFYYQNGSSYYSQYALAYEGESSDGYRFGLQLDSGDYPFYRDDPKIARVRIFLMDLSGNEVLDEYDINLQFGDYDLAFDDWSYIRYTNTDTLTISGTASPNAAVTIVSSDNKITQNVQADSYGRFTTQLSELEEGTYYLSLSETPSVLVSYKTYTLCVDMTEPVITNLRGTLSSSGENIVLSWECEEDNLSHYLIWRDDILVVDQSKNLRVNQYIVAGSLGTSFQVQAIDSAGNSSEKASCYIGDEEPPTKPGPLSMSSHSTQSITFSWDSATDDVAVYQYEIYRNGTLVETLPYDETSYVDSGLEEKTAYDYAVKAVDRAGNQSEPSSATYSTAELLIDEYDELQGTYIIEENPDGIHVRIRVNSDDPLQDLSASKAYLQYRKTGTADWTDFELSNTYKYAFNGYWLLDEIEAADYEVQYKLTDKDGTEEITAPSTITIAHDTEEPSVSITYPVADASVGGQNLEVRFHAEDNVAVSVVELFYSLTGDSDFSRFAELSNPNSDGATAFSGTAPFNEASLLATGKVYLKAVAHDPNGNTGESQVFSFTVDNTPPETPVGFFVGGDKEKITIMWEYPDVAVGGDFSHFNVYRSVNQDGPFDLISEIATIGFFDTTDTGVAENTEYFYYVTAEDTHGNESDGTPVLSGVLLDDDEKPQIVAFTPVSGHETYQQPVSVCVTAIDNYSLSECILSYQQSPGASGWIDLVTLTNDKLTRGYNYNYVWDTSSLIEGDYVLRATVKDVAGNVSQETTSIAVLTYREPTKPILVVSCTEHKQVDLSWTYNGQSELVAQFVVYRSEDNQTWSEIARIPGSKLSYSDVLTFEGSSKQLYYMVEVVDAAGHRVASEVVPATALSQDTTAPTAVILPGSEVLAAVNKPIVFSASASYDNDKIVQYDWDFGDGTTSDKVDFNKTYSASGNYTVRLYVRDESGNENTAEQRITVVDLSNDTEFCLLTLNICDALTLAPIPGAFVTVRAGEVESQYKADESGHVTCLVPRDSCTINVVSENASRTVQYNSLAVTEERTIGLTSSSVMSGELTATEMTYDEILAAGIDPNDPDNQHVFKFETVFEFTAGLQTYEIPLTIFKNGVGNIVKSSGGGFFTFPAGSGIGSLSTNEFKVGLFPISENFTLVIYGEARWLKEMYRVELVVTNHSLTDPLSQISAELDIPDGLSLADTHTHQDVLQTIATIPEGSSESFNWYVRGDKEGSYNFSAKVQAFSPASGVISQTYTTSSPIHVYAGSALHLTITASDIAERGEPYEVTFRLQNVSDKTIYGMSFGITGIEQFKVLRVGDKTGELPIESEDFSDQFIRKIDQMDPGDYIEITISTTIWFNSIAELGEGAFKTFLNTQGLGILGNFVDVVYYLQGVTVTALEGSTTTIPYTINIERSERPNLVLEIYEAAKDLYGKDDDNTTTLGNTLVEILGYELPTYIQTGSKFVLSTAQGATDYEITITLADGTKNGMNLENETISIHCEDFIEGFVDQLNSVKLTEGKDGTITFSGLQSGESEVQITLMSDGAELNYTIPVTVGGKEVNIPVKIPVNPDKWFELTSEMASNLLGDLQEQEKKAYGENPFAHFESRIQLDIQESDNARESMIQVGGTDLNNILENSTLSYLDINSSIALLSLNRQVLEKLTAVAPQDDALTQIILRKLTEETAPDFLDLERPTYEFLLRTAVGDVLQNVSTFDDGTVKVEIPYVLQPGEDADQLEIQYIKEDGTYDVIPSQYDAQRGMITFETNHFSYYRIGLASSGSATPPEDDSNNPPVDSSEENQGSGSTSPLPESTPPTVTANTETQTTDSADQNSDVTTVIDEDGNKITTTINPDSSIIIREERTDSVIIETTSTNGKTTVSVVMPEDMDSTEIEVPVWLGEKDGQVSLTVTYSDGTVEQVTGRYSNGKITFTVKGSASILINNDFVEAPDSPDVVDNGASQGNGENSGPTNQEGSENNEQSSFAFGTIAVLIFAACIILFLLYHKKKEREGGE